MARKARKNSEESKSAETPAEAGNVETGAQAEVPVAPPEKAPANDSFTFTRCASCKNAEDIDAIAGTLLCARHNMTIDAEADEIPDDCVEYEEKEAAQTNQ